MTRTYIIKFRVETSAGNGNTQVVKTYDHVITDTDAVNIRQEITKEIEANGVTVSGWSWESITLIDHD